MLQNSQLSGLELKCEWCLQIPQGFPLAGQINQANYAQFAAVLAQQAARQRQAQELAAQQVRPCTGHAGPFTQSCEVMLPQLLPSLLAWQSPPSLPKQCDSCTEPLSASRSPPEAL